MVYLVMMRDQSLTPPIVRHFQILIFASQKPCKNFGRSEAKLRSANPVVCTETNSFAFHFVQLEV